MLHTTPMYCDKNFGRMPVVFLQGTCRHTCFHMQFYMRVRETWIKIYFWSNYLVKDSKAVSKLCVQRLSSQWTKERFPAHCSRLPLSCDPTVGMRHGHALSPLHVLWLLWEGNLSVRDCWCSLVTLLIWTMTGPQLPFVPCNTGRVMSKNCLTLYQLTRPRGIVTGELLGLNGDKIVTSGTEIHSSLNHH